MSLLAWPLAAAPGRQAAEQLRCGQVKRAAAASTGRPRPGRVPGPWRAVPRRARPAAARRGITVLPLLPLLEVVVFYFLKYMYSSWNWNCVSDAYAFGLPDIDFFH